MKGTIARRLLPLCATTLLATACSSSSFDGVDVDIKLRVAGPSAPITVAFNDGDQTMDLAVIGLADVHLVECDDLARATKTLRDTLQNWLVPTAYAHGVNTPVSNGTPYALVVQPGVSLEHNRARAFYPADNFRACGVRLTFAAPDHDAVFMELMPEGASARIFARLDDSEVSAQGRDTFDVPLDAPATIDSPGQHTLELTLDADVDTLALDISSGASPEDRANALFDALATQFEARIIRQ